jgi:hypothetical protein
MPLVATSEWTSHGGKSFSDAATELEQALEEAARLGARYANGRFVEYVRSLRKAASFDYPRVLPWKPGSGELELFVESVSQGYALAGAANFWSELRREDAANKLTKILAGAAIPRHRSEVDRQARDVLVELAVANLLRTSGRFRKVVLTAVDEDVRASSDGYPDLITSVSAPRRRSLSKLVFGTDARNFVKDVMARRRWGSSFSASIGSLAMYLRLSQC